MGILNIIYSFFSTKWTLVPRKKHFFQTIYVINFLNLYKVKIVLYSLINLFFHAIHYNNQIINFIILFQQLVITNLTCLILNYLFLIRQLDLEIFQSAQKIFSLILSILNLNFIILNNFIHSIAFTIIEKLIFKEQPALYNFSYQILKMNFAK